MYSAIPHEEVLHPETVLPGQFQQIWHGTNAVTPERALAVNVLWQAADDLVKHRCARQRKRQRLFMDAYRWIASDDRTWPYSFLNICDVLSLSPRALRTELLELDRVPVDTAA